MKISISRLRTYMLCSKQYEYRYQLSAPPEFTSASLVFGSAMHHAVAEYHQSQNTLTPEQMYGEFCKYWEAVSEESQQAQRDIHFKSNTQETLLHKAFALCAVYIKNFKEVTPASPDDVELLFEVPLFDPQSGLGTLEHTLTGKIDLIANGCIYEFKTGGRSVSQSEANSSIQLTAYALAHHYLFDEPPQTLKLVTLTTTKTPKISVINTHRSCKDFQHLVEMGMAIARTIDAGIFYRNPEYLYGCHNCEHGAKCRGFQPQYLSRSIGNAVTEENTGEAVSF